MGDYKGAAAAWAIALAQDPGMRQAKLNRADALSNYGGEHKEALGLLNQVISEDSQSITALLSRGSILFETHEPANAAEDYSRVIELLPDLSLGYEKRAHAWDGAHRPDKAIADYGEAIKRSSSAARFYHSRALSYYRQQRFDAALKDWDQALRLDKKYAKEIAAYRQRIREMSKRNRS
jgi:tetratricopeptide (TPR) repeat protein